MKLPIKSLDEIRTGYLRTIRVLQKDEGIEPDTNEGSEFWIDASAFAQWILTIDTTVLAASEAAMPDTATGPDLDRHALVVGLARRGARVSSGALVLASNGATLVAAETELTDPNGNIFFVTGGGTFANEDSIAISAREGGATQNLAAGTILKWKDIPAGALKTAVVAPGGLTGGAQAENDVSLRQRISDKFSNPANAGNWQHLKNLVEESTADVHGWIYEAVNGPGTVHIAASRSPTATNVGRDVDDSVLDNEIRPYVEGLYPVHVDLVVTSVDNQETDVAIALSLSESGGWKDATPFPQSTTFADVLSVTSDTRIRVNSTTTPTPGKRVVWISPEFKIYRATILLAEPVFSDWSITMDAPLTGIQNGDWLFPDFGELEIVLAATLNAFASLGPGQKTSQAGLLPKALRKPLTTQSNPSNLNSAFLRQLTLAAESVQDTEWQYRSISAPSIPFSVSSAPRVLIPRKLAFYPINE